MNLATPLPLRALRHWWWLLAAATLVGAAAAYAGSTRLAPTYEATTTLLVVPSQGQRVIQLNELQAAERLASTFSRLITLRPVLERAVAEGELPYSAGELARHISVRNPASTQLLAVSARANDANTAAHAANAIANAFIASNQDELSTRPGAVSVIETAEAPRATIAPRLALNAAGGGVLLLLVAGGLALALEYRDDTIDTAEDATAASGLPVLGRLVRFDTMHAPSDALQAANHPHSMIAEAYRAARTSLWAFLDGSEDGVILATSPGQAEGKSTTVANLAIVFGAAGHRVCVIDSDLRRPTLHRLFGLRNRDGLSGLLRDARPDLDAAIQRSVHRNVSVVTSGPPPHNPSELLGSARMEELLGELKARFDIVIMDSPPALAVTDASVLSTLVDAMVVVVRAGQTRRGPLLATLRELAHSGRPIAGLIVNGLATRHAASYEAYGPYRLHAVEEGEEERTAA